jgi:hypothetical protein
VDPHRWPFGEFCAPGTKFRRRGGALGEAVEVELASATTNYQGTYLGAFKPPIGTGVPAPPCRARPSPGALRRTRSKAPAPGSWPGLAKRVLPCSLSTGRSRSTVFSEGPSNDRGGASFMALVFDRMGQGRLATAGSWRSFQVKVQRPSLAPAPRLRSKGHLQLQLPG